jgi:predicted metal-binding membrane protein
MRMPGGTWLGAGASFAGMWAVMMIAMMLPSVAPMLWRCREAVGSREVGGGRRMTLVAAGYFAVWTALGIVVYPLGVGFADFAMRSDSVARVVPIADALVVAMAGLVQLTAWKARALACCRMVPGPPHAHSPWRLGLRLGIRCVSCCAGPTAVLLVLGVMDLRAMAAVTAAIGAERLAPAGERVARATGFVAVAASVLAMAGRMLW